MFAVRGTIISLAVFAIVYCAASLAVLVTWKNVWPRAQRHSARQRTDALFALRLLPLVSAILVTAVFAVPSFVILEPHAIEERMGIVPVALALVGLALAGLGLAKSLAALRGSCRRISEWTRAAEKMETDSPVTVLRVSATAPAMTAVGIVRPKVLLSNATRTLLSPNELQTALNHELAHVRRQDNLRKLLLQFAVFPGMSGLEAAWLEATEMAADDAAVSNSSEAVELASALIKLSRCVPLAPPLGLTAALVHSPASLVDARVKRLVAWNEETRTKRNQYSIWRVLWVALATTTVLVLTYGGLLIRVHTATEWLLR